MARKRLTQLFPFLLPLRRRQRIFCFYLKMRLDGNIYAEKTVKERLPYLLFTSACPMYNRSTGFDMAYQQNKVFNLKLAAAALDGLVIAPGETFSFWHCVRHADSETPYRDGLAEIDGVLRPQYGGGLCQLSNLLCWLFLHTPLQITERHGHRKKDFPEPPSDAPLGVDATVNEGWLDLRAHNGTDAACQISISFDEENIIGQIYAAKPPGRQIQVINRNLRRYRENGEIIEQVEVVQQIYDSRGKLAEERTAYTNRCRIAYPLPEELIEK